MGRRIKFSFFWGKGIITKISRIKFLVHQPVRAPSVSSNLNLGGLGKNGAPGRIAGLKYLKSAMTE
jgi:hypothetical protein